MTRPPIFLSALLVTTLGTIFLFVTAALGAETDPYPEHVGPFVEKFCVRCHGSTKPKGELDLSRVSNAQQVTSDFRRWENVIEFIRKGEMPPEDEPQPELAQRNSVIAALEAILLEEAKRYAGDPGIILPRRLSNTEYDLSIRDLTGIDMRPTRDFPADPAAGEGFDNTGEALGMSPSLLRKYIAAAQEVADHLVLKTDGIEFAPFPVTSYNEQKKLTEGAITDFYQRNAVRIADYLDAAWHYRHREQKDRAVDVEAWAQRRGLSGKYLALVWTTLNDARNGAAFLQQVGQAWDAIPAPRGGPVTRSGRSPTEPQGTTVRSPGAQETFGQTRGGVGDPRPARDPRPPELDSLLRLIEFAQRQWCHRDEALIQSNAGNWPISHLAFRTKVAERRDQFDPGNLQSRRLVRFDRLPSRNANSTDGHSLYLRIERAFDDGHGGLVVIRRPLFSKSKSPPRNDEETKEHEVVTLRAVLEKFAPELAERLKFGKHPDGTEIDVDSFVLQAPALLELPLSAEVLRQHDQKQLLMDCELDAAQRERSVYVQSASGGKPSAELYAGNTELLMYRDSDLATAMVESAERFCHAFPNRFCYVDDERGLAAGFHLVEGFFRDDQPLVKKVLDVRQQRELDQLWQELTFVTKSTETLLRGFVWFERSERHVLHDARFDFLRDEDPKLVEEEFFLLGRFERVYLEKLGVKLVEGEGVGKALQPQQPTDKYNLIHGFFEQIRGGLTLHREQLQRAEPKALADLLVLAERAYRRPLRAEETESLHSLYDDLRQRGQSVEAALRGVFVDVLMSPNFFLLYQEPPTGTGLFPLSDDALASRLSYFLWSSLPDDELRAAARAGQLNSDEEIVAQTRRMLKSPRIASFSREFFGQWLRYRDYLSKDAINAASFPGYDEPLREAMFEEPVRLTTYLIQNDQPITKLLNSDITFVNAVLAKHYGGDILEQYSGKNQPASDTDSWRRVEGLRASGRGGIFGMGVVLTKLSKAERTSPVKRGFWAVHHLLGQHFPPPPADVPELPPGEKQASKTIRELIQQHTENPKCAICHTHFDSLGMALEGFDPIGRARTHDLAGRPIDNVVVFPDGKTAQGIPGLIEHIEQHRRHDFVRTMCRKFLGYALGRSVVLSDEPLLSDMEKAIEKGDDRFSVLFEMVVRSTQFRQQRGRDYVTP